MNAMRSKIWNHPDAGLLIFRAVVGTVFIAHGAQKFFSYGIGGVEAGFAQMGVPLPGVTAALVAGIELLGGLALLLGLFTRGAALLIAAVMAGATVMVHLPAGFFLPSGYEFTLTLLAAAVGLALTGPGRFSLDHVLARRHGETRSLRLEVQPAHRETFERAA